MNKHIHTHTHTHFPRWVLPPGVYFPRCVLPLVCTSPGVYFPWCVLPPVCTSPGAYFPRCVLPLVRTSPGVYFPWCVLPLVCRWQCAHNYSTVTYVGLTRRSRFSLEVGEGCLQSSDVVGDVVVGRHRLHERSLTVARSMGSAKKGTLRVYHGKHRGREGKNVKETTLLAKVGGY